LIDDFAPFIFVLEAVPDGMYNSSASYFSNEKVKLAGILHRPSAQYG
jgi:hypothetical protein